MSIELVRRKAQETITELGRAALHITAPNDFEYYGCTLELLDSRGTIENIFHFPVMPNGMSIDRRSLVSFQKTGSGYASYFSDSFVGRTIQLKGSFGRRFRLMLSKGIGRESGDNSKPLNFKNLVNDLDLKVKTGYGATKLLEKLIESSQQLDEYKNPKILIFYNSAINHNHIVEVQGFSLTQSLENNMLWNWSLELKSVANAEDLILVDYNSKKHIKALVAMSSINKSINSILNSINIPQWI